MALGDDRLRRIADRVSMSLSAAPHSETVAMTPDDLRTEISHLKDVIRNLEERLSRLESASTPKSQPARSPWAIEHPSHDRFNIDDAVAELVEHFEQERACGVEPGPRRCDGCARCSSLGF